jgi:diguanylate cyclase (GGDEF)-like protein
MVVLMTTIIWQMHNNVVNERKQSIRAQVVSILGVVEKIYGDHKQGALSEADAKQTILSTIEAIKYPGSGYFWIIDTDGKMLMHPYDKKIIGKHVLDLQDANNRPFVKEFIIAASSGGGFVFYDWSRPYGGDVAAKIAYVMPFKPWGWVVGSGLYVDDLRAEARRQISMSAVLVFILLGVNIAVLLYVSRRFLHAFREGAVTDALTGLYTRRYLDEVGDRIVSRSEAADGPSLAAIFLDIDHFKQVNDRYGHKAGDTVLRTVGRILKDSLRPNELAFRYGGEEIVILLHASEDNCRSIAERIRAAVNNQDFCCTKGEFNVTLSAGIAVGRNGESLYDLLQRADMCLYSAKEQGRDRTVTESELTASTENVI